MYKLRTVDVWDTLLRRNCHPECIKLSTAFHIFLQFRDEIVEDFPDHWAIYKKRLDIEAKLASEARAAGNDDEYNIQDVFQYWLNNILNTPCASGIVEETVEYELFAEIAQSSADHHIVALLEENPGDTTIFLSDFYMGSTLLQRLLDSKGLSGVVSTGISSCDVGRNKRSGSLFEFVHEKYQVEAKDHFHVGDNFYSDVEAARRLGIAAVHYLPEKPHEERLMREQLFISRNVLFDHIISKTREATATRNSALGGQGAEAFALGVEAAPLFLGFCSYIAECAIKGRLDALYFLTREGEFFQKIFNLLYEDGKFFGHSLPRVDVLEVSRIATFAASMHEISIDEFQRIWRLFHTQKIGGLFKTLGLNASEFSDVLEESNLTAETIVESPESDIRVQKLLTSERFISAATASIFEKRRLAKAYLSSMGLEQKANIGVVDIGWRGTIQDNISLILPSLKVQGFYLGLRCPVNPQPKNVEKFSYAVSEADDVEWAKYFEGFAALEMICNSPHGSVERYVEQGGGVVAERLVEEDENKAYYEFSKYFQDGVLAAATTWRPYLDSYVVTAAELKPLALKVWKGLIDKPPGSMVNAFLSAPQHDVFGFGELFNRSEVPSLMTMGRSIFDTRARREVIDFVRRVQWTSAVDHLKGVGRVHRLALKLTFVVAHAVKSSSLYQRSLRR